MKLTFLRDTELFILNHPLGLDDLYFEKGEELLIDSFTEVQDQLSVRTSDGLEVYVMKESVEITD